MSKAYLNGLILIMFTLSLVTQIIFTFMGLPVLFYSSLIIFVFAMIPFFRYNISLLQGTIWILITLVLIFIMPFLLYFTGNGQWIGVSFFVLLYPAIFEEVIFRGYILFSLKSLGYMKSLLLESLIYTLYYSRFIFLDDFKAFPFPYNSMMLLSMFSMGVVYSLVDLKTKNLYPSIILHYVIWSIFPILALYIPALASLLVPT